MRRTGIVIIFFGCSATIIGIVFAIFQPFVCVGALAIILGLILTLSTNWIRGIPTVAANGAVRSRFEQIANDPFFQHIARLREDECQTLLDDLSTASIRYSKIVQGGYAGRDDQGMLVLALSRWHLRSAPAAHELFHLARDVIYRSRNGKAGKSLDATTGILQEEIFVWIQTLSYLPIYGAVEIGIPLALVVAVAPYGIYLLARFAC
jgi:hypothetical protein